MRNVLTFAAGCCVIVSVCHAQSTDAFRHEEGKHLDFLRDGKPLVRYMYAFDVSDPGAREETYKVYHHVFDPDGKDFITKGQGGKYTHHRGIFLGWSRLGHGGRSYDHWHMKNVTMVHQRFTRQEADDKSATVTSVIHWNDPDGKPMIEETRTLTVHFADDDAHLLADFETELQAVDGEVQLRGDPEHAGVQYRPHNDVAGNKSAKYTFHADDLNLKKDYDLPWVAMTYKLKDQVFTVQHMRHPDDPKKSVYSAYRDYGRFGNFFVTTIPDGETLTLRYRFRITLGEAPPREQLARQWEKYVGE
jgi:hypothetical protein